MVSAWQANIDSCYAMKLPLKCTSAYSTVRRDLRPMPILTNAFALMVSRCLCQEARVKRRWHAPMSTMRWRISVPNQRAVCWCGAATARANQPCWWHSRRDSARVLFIGQPATSWPLRFQAHRQMRAMKHLLQTGIHRVNSSLKVCGKSSAEPMRRCICWTNGMPTWIPRTAPVPRLWLHCLRRVLWWLKYRTAIGFKLQ